MSNKYYTLSSSFKKELYFNYRDFISSHKHKPWKMGDYPLWLYISNFSNVFCISESTGIYRILKQSASHAPDPPKQAEFELSAYDVRIFFAKTFNRSDLLKRITTNLVYTLQRISLINNSSIRYDIWGLYKKYGFSDAGKLFAKHYVLQNKVLRNLYVRFVERNSKNFNKLRI